MVKHTLTFLFYLSLAHSINASDGFGEYSESSQEETLNSVLSENQIHDSYETELHDPLSDANSEALKFIIADDNKMTQLIMKRIIQQNGGEVVCVADDGKELVSAVRENECDIIITDGQMPGLNAPEAIQIIRPLKPHLPIYVFTADVSEAFYNECTSAGATKVVFKPVTHEKVIGCLNQTCIMKATNDPAENHHPPYSNATPQTPN